MKKKIILAVIIIVALGALYWVSSHSYLEIEVKNLSEPSQIDYKLTDQSNQSAKKILSSSSHIKKIVSKGRYQVLISSGDKNSFALVETKGFLKNTQLQTELQQESLRQFVGNQPDQNNLLVNQTLVSYDYLDLYSNIKVHIPATASQPTFKNKVSAKGISGYIEGIIKTNEGLLALIHNIPISEGLEDNGHSIYKLNNDLSVASQTQLSQLSKNNDYLIKTYGEGFIVYTKALDEIQYFPSSGSQSTELKADKPQDNNLIALSVDFTGNNVLALYGQTLNPEDRVNPKKSKQEIVESGDQSFRLSLNNRYSKILFCGDSKVCLFGEDKLDIYEGSKRLISLRGVQDIGLLKNKLVVVINEGVLLFDTNTKNGYIDYSFEGYSFNNLEVENVSYLLTLTNSKGRKIGLLIDSQQKNTDSIDKKVAELQKMPEVSDVSIQGKFIYISPQLGEPVFIKEIDGFGYSVDAKKSANDKINAEIDRLGIDRKTYTIVNTAD